MTLPEPVAAPDRRRAPRWAGPILFVCFAVIVALAGMLAVSIMERRWEAQRPLLIVQPIGQWEPDSAVWGRNYPRQYETYLKTRIDTTRTRYGGAAARDYLDETPDLVVLFAGYPFSKDYRQARGHYWSVSDVAATGRVGPTTVATCWTCKSADVPRLISQLGAREFYGRKFADLKDQVTHPIGCQDCHDPASMRLKITRPALAEAYAATGRDIGQAGHQEMRSLVCAQCHVEYYFKDKTYLTLPWARGTDVESMIAYYDEHDVTDWTHGISKAPMVKAQHPDYEIFLTGVHAYRGVSCADCHMPYRTEGGAKFTSHHVQSPLLDLSSSCSVCHRWSETELRERVESIQHKYLAARTTAERTLAAAHFDVAAAAEAGASDADLAHARKLIRHAQFRWDYVAASNSMGFHSPQESMRILADAIAGAGEARLAAARLLAARGAGAQVKYPDISTRAKAAGAIAPFVEGKAPKLLP